MAKPRTRQVVFFAAIGCLALLLPASAAPARPGARTTPGFAVVELFTSEGCSSCPPADALLADLASEARSKRLAIYCLAFHVDYWNRLGWKDPYSEAAYSGRQKSYARVMHFPGVYTPQMIVNGTEEFVGSDASRAEHAIERALARAGTVRVTLHLSAATTPPAGAPPKGRTTAAVHYTVAGAPKHAVLQVAAVEGGLVSSVARGENAGRVLHQDNVVRSFATVPLDEGADGTVNVMLPPGTAPSRTAFVGYVQDRTTMAILGAGAITGLSTSPAATSGRN